MRTTNARLPASPSFDVAVCGGTLGIFLACSLQIAGLRVIVVEAGRLQGRDQEWNISRKELKELVRIGYRRRGHRQWLLYKAPNLPSITTEKASLLNL